MSKKSKKKEQDEEQIRPDITSESTDNPLPAPTHGFAPPRPFHKPTLKGSVRPFGGRGR